MKKALAALTIALLVLAGLFVGRKAWEANAARTHAAYADMPVDAVVRLHVAYWGDSVTLVKSGGEWLVARDAFPADTARLRRVLGHLLGLRTRELVSRASADGLKAFDLDDASARRATWTLADGRSATVLLGKVSGIDYGSSFWKPADEAVIYRTPGTFVFDVSSRSQDWKDTALFTPFPEAAIQTVAVTWHDAQGLLEHYTLERDPAREESSPDHAHGAQNERNTRFVLVGEEGARTPARREEAARVFRHATQFKVDSFVAGVDTAATPSRRASLEDPFMTVDITLQDGTRHAVIAGDVVHDLYRYVKHPRHPDPVRVFVWRFDYFAKKAEDFR